MFLSPNRMMDMYTDAMRIKNSDFEIARGGVPVIIDDDVDRALSQIKQNVGFYVGGMGCEELQRAQGSHHPNGVRRGGRPRAGTIHGRSAR